MKTTKLELLLSAQAAAQSSLQLANNHEIAQAKLSAFEKSGFASDDFDEWNRMFDEARSQYMLLQSQPSPNTTRLIAEEKLAQIEAQAKSEQK